MKRWANALPLAGVTALLLVNCIGDAPIPPLGEGPDGSAGDGGKGADGGADAKGPGDSGHPDGTSSDAPAPDANPCNGITQCVAGDMCCPAGCTHATDTDCAIAVCGDGTVEPGETCDDGNLLNGDGCDPTCMYANTLEHVSGFTGGVGYADSDAGANVRFGKQGGITTDGTVIYYADPDGTIRSIDPANGASTTIAGSNGNTGTSTDGAGTAARFVGPTALSYVDATATDGEKLLFVVDGANLRSINVRDPSFPVTTLLTSQTGLVSVANGMNSSGPTIVALETSEASTYQITPQGTMSAGPIANQTQLNDVAYGGTSWGSANCHEVYFAGYSAATNTGTYYFGCPDTILKVSVGASGSGTVTLLAGVPNTAGCSNNASATAATLTHPTGLNVDASGTLYFNDCNQVRQVNSSGVTTYAGTAAAGYGDATGGSLTSAQFSALGAGARIASSLYVVDGPRIRTVSGTTTSTLASGSGSRGNIVDGSGAGPSYAVVLALATDGSGNIYALASDRVLKVDPTTGGSSLAFTFPAVDGGIGNPISMTAMNGKLYIFFDGGTVWSSGFDGAGFTSFATGTLPTTNDVTNDGTNLYYIRNDRVIAQIGPSGTVGVVVGHSDGATQVTDGSGSNAFFANPMGISYVGGGTLYVADYFIGFGDILLRKIDIAAGSVLTVAGNMGSNAGPQVDGVGPAAGFGAIQHLASDGTSLFVVDKGFAYTIPLLDGPTIRQMNLTDTQLTSLSVTTMIGALGQFAAAPGVGKGARINNPSAIVYDPVSKHILVGDESSIFHIR